MHWQPHYDPLNHAALSTVVAALPVVVLLGSTAIPRIRIHYAALDRAFNLTAPISWVGRQTNAQADKPRTTPTTRNGGTRSRP